MDDNKPKPTNASKVRQEAEALLRKQYKKASLPTSETDLLKLIHELEVHQIQLELINEELMQANHRANEATEKYEELYEFAPSGYFTLSRQGEILETNLNGTQMLGKERAHLINRRIAVFISNDTRVVFDAFLSQVFEGQSPASCEATFITGEGLHVYVHLNGSLADDEKRCLITAVDITKSKLAEKALKDSEERYALVIDASEQGIWDWNVETNEIFYSKQWKRQIGYEDSEISNEFGSWVEHLHPDESADCEKTVKAYLENPTFHFFLEFRFRHKDGSYRWIYNKASSILNSQGRVVRMFGTHTDITESKRAELQIIKQNAELQKLNATKDKFFSIIAHDLKSPFNSIMGFSELLIENIETKDYNEITKYAGIILQSSRRAMNLLLNLMEWSRSQTGRMAFNPTLFDMGQLITDIKVMFDAIAGQKGIEIKSQLPSNAVAFADQTMINTVLRNLISNAIKFTKQGGEINLQVTKEANRLTVTVKDNGIGIAKNRIDKLFRIDENYSTNGTANEEGTGLGLILCKEFIEKHNGEIGVTSEEGKGSAFYFALPTPAPQSMETSERQAEPSQKQAEARRLKILVAEDDEVSEILIDSYIKIFCDEVLKARTGVEAVEACRKNPDIDLILMDIRMPQMDGYEAVKRIREFNQKVVIIAQTAHGLTGDRKKSIEAGCNDYLSKPINKAELRELIKSFFAK